jgi:hypothetical protein
MKIIFKFAGGPLDGKSIVGEAGEQDEADRYYTLTNHGRIGQRFRIASEYAIDMLTREQLKEERPHRFQEHVYQVTDRLEDDKKIFMRAEYVQEEAKED